MQDRAEARQAVRQFGPAIGTDGGIASVLEVYSRLPLTRYRLEFVPTWAPDARLWGAMPFTRAMTGLLLHRANRANRANRAPIAHLHLSERGSFVREGALAEAARRRGARVVLSLHGRDFAKFAGAHSRLVRHVFAQARAVIALGPTTAGVARRYLRPDVRLAVVPNPIEVPESVTPAGAQPETVLFGGEVGRVKGVDVLLDAWGRVRSARPEAQLLVAGPPGDYDPVEREGVTWLGLVPRARLQELIASSRVAVLPSRAEVMPMFLLEAMAEARPVVTTPIADIPSLVGDVGRLVAVGDPSDLADRISELLADPTAATAEGHALRCRAISTFAMAPVAAELEALYDAVLAGPA